MSNEKKKIITRRNFLGGAAATAAAFTIVPRHVLGGPGQKSPSEKLNIAGVGVGGKGFSDMQSVRGENIVALCDVDHSHAAKAFKGFPQAKVYSDYRVMLEKQKDIDAVVVATPDHTHAVITMAALKMGKHVFCQKPLTHTVYEAQKIAEAAQQAKVATQMGNQGQASVEARLLYELIRDGAIGQVREIHGWSNRYPRISPRGIPRPKETPPVPSTMDWDLWLGPAPTRPYHPCYAPFTWRGWWDFGCGVLGDIACHNFSAIFKTLNLGYPSRVEACSSNYQCPEEIRNETAPLSSIVRFTFPPNEVCPGLELTWYDGGIMPPRPEELEPDRQFGGGDGMLYVGDKGKILNHRLIPEAKMKEYGKPPVLLPRSPGHYEEWIQACKGGKPAGSNFVDHAGLLTEVVLMGVIALRLNTVLYWDSTNKRFTNNDLANQLMNPPYRQGWSL
ncbi:MAG: Gfo/Idh/MocA family oxidoreductase [Sedimentisphaerales bacterium]|nr:Gfo/Idh/MocA family oxidoreductase [Sedimentisphaerales bacterium]